jgi:hypothetical protein
MWTTSFVSSELLEGRFFSLLYPSLELCFDLSTNQLKVLHELLLSSAFSSGPRVSRLALN